MKLFLILSFVLFFVAQAGGCGGGSPTTGAGGSTGGQTGTGGGAGSPSTIGAGGLSASGGAAGGRDGGGGGAAGQVAAGGATGATGDTGGMGGAAGAGPGGSHGTGTGGSGAAGSGAGEVAFGADRVIVTGVRATTSPAATSSINLHNGGSTAVQVTGLVIAGTAQLTLGPSGAAVEATSAPVAGAPLFQNRQSPDLSGGAGSGPGPAGHRAADDGRREPSGRANQQRHGLHAVDGQPDGHLELRVGAGHRLRIGPHSSEL